MIILNLFLLELLIRAVVIEIIKNHVMYIKILNSNHNILSMNCSETYTLRQKKDLYISIIQ